MRDMVQFTIMRQCSRCWEYKPESIFSTKQGRCNPCRNEDRARARIYAKTGHMPDSTYVELRVTFLRKILRRYDGTSTLEIPVKAFHAIVEARKACLLQRKGSQDWYSIASMRGQRQVAYDQCGPNDLINVLREMGLELILPNDKDIHGETKP